MTSFTSPYSECDKCGEIFSHGQLYAWLDSHRKNMSDLINILSILECFYYENVCVNCRDTTACDNHPDGLCMNCVAYGYHSYAGDQNGFCMNCVSCRDIIPVPDTSISRDIHPSRAMCK